MPELVFKALFGSVKPGPCHALLGHHHRGVEPMAVAPRADAGELLVQVDHRWGWRVTGHVRRQTGEARGGSGGIDLGLVPTPENLPTTPLAVLVVTQVKWLA